MGARSAAHADGPLDFGVEGLHLVIGQRPIIDVGALLRAVVRAESEVLLPKPRHLAVSMDPATAHRGGDRVHLAHMGVLAVVSREPKGAWLDERIGTEEVAGQEFD